jgi:hypothetical protein
MTSFRHLKSNDTCICKDTTKLLSRNNDTILVTYFKHNNREKEDTKIQMCSFCNCSSLVFGLYVLTFGTHLFVQVEVCPRV